MTGADITDFSVKPCPSELNTSHVPNDKLLDLYKLKAFADDKINVTLKLKFAMEWVENIVGNTMFSKGDFSRIAKSQDCVVKTVRGDRTRHLCHTIPTFNDLGKKDV